MISVTGLVFSITMVVLQLAQSQFSSEGVEQFVPQLSVSVAFLRVSAAVAMFIAKNQLASIVPIMPRSSWSRMWQW